MDDRPNELFLLDAEQAAREVAQFGSGQIELRTERLVSTIEYLDSILRSLGLDHHATFCGGFAAAVPFLDGGQSRRLAREFVALAEAQFEAIRSEDVLPDHHDLLARLSAKLPQKTATERGANLAQQGRLFQDAARAIAAVDELAHRIQDGLENASSEANLTLPDDPVGEAKVWVESDPLQADPFQGLAVPSTVQANQNEARIAEPSPEVPPPCEHSGPLAADHKRSDLYPSARIDQAFRRALKLTESGPWITGVGALLESIDDLDHIPLAILESGLFSWAAGASIKVRGDLALGLNQLLSQYKVVGMGDAFLVAHTVIVAMQLEMAVPVEPFSKLVAGFGGRLEHENSSMRLRFVIPASSRLLRVVPLRMKEGWIAVPWAQLLSTDDEKALKSESRGQIAADSEGIRLAVRLSIGDESDQLLALQTAPATVGVRFDLPDVLRRRERYRGLVLTPDGSLYPIYG